MSPSGERPTVPLDDMAKTPKALQPFGQFMEENNAAITPYDDGRGTSFPFPATAETLNRQREDRQSRVTVPHRSTAINGKTVMSMAASVMSVCSEQQTARRVGGNVLSSFF